MSNEFGSESRPTLLDVLRTRKHNHDVRYERELSKTLISGVAGSATTAAVVYCAVKGQALEAGAFAFGTALNAAVGAMNLRIAGVSYQRALTLGDEIAMHEHQADNTDVPAQTIAGPDKQ